MEEKKLTDGELLRLLAIFAKDDEPNGVRLLAEGALDLINRLQRENANVIAMNDTLYSEKVTLKSELKKEHAEHEEFTKKAKAEIERLTEERDVYLDDCSAVRHKIRQEIEEKFELQKQVDELTDKLGKVLSGIKADELLIAKGVEQAVKDTAKEICDLILEHWEKKQFVECDWLRVAISEKYGVEVE